MYKTITICSSVACYGKAFEIEDQLKTLGMDVLLPMSAEEMNETGDFCVESSKTWFENPADFYKKTDYMRDHLRKIDKGDAVLITNFEKDGVSGYIGGNVLLEMFYAWLHGKPVYVLHPVPEDLPLYEEVIGLNPIILNGNIKEITDDVLTA